MRWSTRLDALTAAKDTSLFQETFKVRSEFLLVFGQGIGSSSKPRSFFHDWRERIGANDRCTLTHTKRFSKWIWNSELLLKQVTWLERTLFYFCRWHLRKLDGQCEKSKQTGRLEYRPYFSNPSLWSVTSAVRILVRINNRPMTCW